MLILLPVVGNAFGLRAWYLTQRADKEAEEAEQRERHFRERFQAELEKMESRGEIIVKPRRCRSRER